jgi:hypothetical protein
MSITIDLPPDVEDRLRAIPDLDQRIAEFLRHQTSLEEWRERRYSPAARAVMAEAQAEADKLAAEGVSREQAFREWREARSEISEQL